RKRVAVLEAHATAVADLEDPRDLLLKGSGIPVFRLARIVAEAVGRGVRDRVGRGQHHLGRFGENVTAAHTRRAAVGENQTLRRSCRAWTGSGRRGPFRPWPGSRTSRRSR